MALFMERYSKFIFLLIILTTSLAHLATSRRLTEEVTMLAKHEEWMVRHGRVYNSKEERDARFKIFKDNIKFIEDFNRAANHTYKIGITKFTDLTPEEFNASYASGFKESSSSSSHPDDYSGMSFMYENVNVYDLPSSMDWRADGAVTPVKNQGHCYSCWAFAAVASMEAINKIKTGQLISLSEQEILDCMGLQDSCYTGGLPEDAYNFVAQSGGIATESDYPYIEQYHEACRAAAPAARITSFERVPSYDEVSLLKAVANQPVSVGVNADLLQFYPGGVIMTMDYTSPLNHGVSVVGYGTDEETGAKYWLVKNSWGETWGENGYFRVQRDSGLPEGTLGIAKNPAYPVI